MAKRNILVIGCSWSRAFCSPNDDRSWSWPEILARDTGASVYNFSHYCSSVPHQFYQLQHLLLHQGYNFTDVIVQFTTTNRTTMVQSMRNYNELLDPLKLEKSVNYTENYWEVPKDKLISNDDWNGLGIKHLNTGRVPRRWKATFFDLMMYNIGGIGPYSPYITSALQHEMRWLIDHYGKRGITYKHHYSLSPVEEQEGDSEYNKDRSYMDFILQYDMSNFNDFVIDNGFHFGEEGAQRIVDDFIRPRLNL